MTANFKLLYFSIIISILLFCHSTCFANVSHSIKLANDTTTFNTLNIDSITTANNDLCDITATDEPIVQAVDRTSIYALPYSVTLRQPDWHRMWINSAVLASAYVGTLLVLECLPEDATSWNRAELRNQAPFKRWFKNVFKRGPEWDHDKFYFNYILHPYAGAAYFMGARSCGFNMWQSLLYCTCVSTIGWEFGIEAFMERPSIQDLFVTPLVGSAIGEGFYCVKRHLVQHGYRLLGSPVLGNVVAFICDPINEVIGLFAGNEARNISKNLSVMPTGRGFALSASF
jgi:hypothetical protein